MFIKDRKEGYYIKVPSTIALTNVTVPYALQIATKGVHVAISSNEPLKQGVNTADGQVTRQAVAMDLNYEYFSIDKLLVKEKTIATFIWMKDGYMKIVKTIKQP